MSRPDHMAEHARELLGMPPDWQVYRWEVKGAGVHIEGAVANEKFLRGPRKGHTNWAKKDKATEAGITISNDVHRVWLRDWEIKTGHCHKCGGTSEEWAGWDHIEGTKYRPCQRCAATGNAQPDKPIA